MLTTSKATPISVGASFFAASGGGVRRGVAAAVMIRHAAAAAARPGVMYRQIGRSMTAGAVMG